MEDKLRKLLKEIADKQINLASEFAREQILSDIMQIVKRDTRLKIATKVLASILSNGLLVAKITQNSDTVENTRKVLSKNAFAYADAMLSEENS